MDRYRNELFVFKEVVDDLVMESSLVTDEDKKAIFNKTIANMTSLIELIESDSTFNILDVIITFANELSEVNRATSDMIFTSESLYNLLINLIVEKYKEEKK